MMFNETKSQDRVSNMFKRCPVAIPKPRRLIWTSLLSSSLDTESRILETLGSAHGTAGETEQIHAAL